MADPVAAPTVPQHRRHLANDSLADPARVRAFAGAWGSRLHDLGPVGHLNPASGYGDWPEAETLIRELIESHELNHTEAAR